MRRTASQPKRQSRVESSDFPQSSHAESQLADTELIGSQLADTELVELERIDEEFPVDAWEPQSDTVRTRPKEDFSAEERLPSSRPTHSRMDVISGRWTLFASHRSERPNEFVYSASTKLTSEDCPFCLGNEQRTPEPVLVVSASDVPSCAASDSVCAAHGSAAATDGSASEWMIRVIPNKFPAVDPLAATADGDRSVAGGWAAEESAKSSREGESRAAALFPQRTTSGGHEVIIESPEHFSSLADLDLCHVVKLLQVYRQRLEHWSNQPGIGYVSLFKNAGAGAGASLQHPHSQLIALTDLPPTVRTIADRMRRHHARTGCCLQCDLVRAEMKARSRIVAVTDSLVAYCPYASHLPLQLRITTRRHVERFESLDDRELNELARLIRRAILWLDQAQPNAPYNYLLHTRPAAVQPNSGFHWSFDLFPRLTQIAGFEWSCDCLINPLLPEEAAARLREIAIRENPLRC